MLRKGERIQQGPHLQHASKRRDPSSEQTAETAGMPAASFAGMNACTPLITP